MSINLATQFYQLDAVQFSNQRLVNQYLEASGVPESRSPMYIKTTPGSTQFADVVDPIRGMKTVGSLLYVVAGTTFYKIDTAGTKTSLGTVAGADYVDIIYSSTQIMIAAGVNGYVYTISTGAFAAISDADFPGASSATFMDGSAIVSKPNTGQANVSDLNNFSSWDALNFTTEETAPDDLLAIRDDRKELWMFSQNTIVPYARNPALAFPYERISQAVLEMGCLAKNSIVIADNSFIWLGNREAEGGVAVWRAAGYTPIRVSTHAIEQKIETFGFAVSDAIAFTYMLSGHIFYVLNFPSYATFVLDLSTNLWHEWIRTGDEWSRWTHHAFFNNAHIVGGPDGILATLSNTVYDDLGTYIERKMVSPVYDADGQPLRVSRLEIEVDAGRGLTSGQGSDPMMMLRWSKDAGRTWSNERMRSMGKRGAYNSRIIIRNLGRAREWVFESVVTDPVPYSIIKAYANTTVGAT